jgi:hypothetical protein
MSTENRRIPPALQYLQSTKCQEDAGVRAKNQLLHYYASDVINPLWFQMEIVDVRMRSYHTQQCIVDSIFVRWKVVGRARVYEWGVLEKIAIINNKYIVVKLIFNTLGLVLHMM